MGTRCLLRRSRKSWACTACGTDNGSSSQPAPPRVMVSTKALTGYLAPWGAKSSENNIRLAMHKGECSLAVVLARGHPSRVFHKRDLLYSRMEQKYKHAT